MRLENEAFLVELNRLFQTNRDKGSVWVTFKQYEEKKEKETKDKKSTGPVKKQKVDSSEGTSEYKCLIRATDGKKCKISTLVSAKDVVKFQMAYANVLKLQVDNLKRKEKRKKVTRSVQ